MNAVKLEPLEARFHHPIPRLSSSEVQQALQRVLAKIDAQLSRFSATFPAASAVDGRYPAVDKVD